MVAVPLGPGNVTTAIKSGSGNSLAGSIPTNTEVSDVLIAVFTSDQALNAACETPGWVKISTARTGGNRELSVWHAFTADGIPGPPEFVQSAATNIRASVAVYRVVGASQTDRVLGDTTWAAPPDTPGTDAGITLPSTGAGGVTFALAYSNTNAAQLATVQADVRIGGQVPTTHLTSYGANTPPAASATSSSHRIVNSPGPFAVTWGKTVANSNGYAITIPGEAPPEEEHPDEPGVVIQVGLNNVTTAGVNSEGENSIQLPVPSRTVAGDVLLAVVAHSGISPLIFPANWVLISNPRSGLNRTLSVYARQVEAAELPLGPQVFQAGEANARVSGIMARLTGVGSDYLASKGEWQVTEHMDNRDGFTIPATSPAGQAALVVMYANNGANLAPGRFSVGGATEVGHAVADTAGSSNTVVAAFRSSSAGAKTVNITPRVANAAGFQITFQGEQPPVPASWEAKVMRDGVLVNAEVSGVKDGTSLLSPNLVSWKPRDHTLDKLFATTPFFIAHRGSGDNWPEHTMEAYNNAISYGVKAIEVSCQLTADNILVCHHDLDFMKTAKDPRRVRDMTYQEIQDQIRVDTRQWTGLSSTLAPPPLAKDVIDAFIDTNVIFIEDKGGDGTTQLLNLMDSYPRSREKFIWKQWAGAGQWEAAKNRGYKTWGYFMGELYSRIPELVPRHDYVGIMHSASEEVVREIIQVAGEQNKPVIMAEIHYRHVMQRALASGCRGLMCSNVPYVMATSTWQYREDQWHTGKRPHGDLPHTIDGGWSVQPEIDPANGGILRFKERASAAMILGSMCPIGLDSYALEFEMRFPGPLPKDTDHGGLWFGHDRDIAHRGSVASADGGYALIQRVNGSFDLFRHDPNTAAGIPLDSVRAEAVVPGQWMRYRVEVTPEWIAARRLDGAGHSLTSSDSRYRGQYFGVQKNFIVPVSDPLKHLEFRTVRVSPL